jgi:FAD synthetase
MTKVLVFGTFDGLHPGHQAFLSEAREHADELVVAVAQDAIVEQLKNRAPDRKLGERLAALQELDDVHEAVAGDSELGSYLCFKRIQPDIVAFGYDQTELAADFKRFQQATGDETPTIVLKPYHPETYKSSLLRG